MVNGNTIAYAIWKDPKGRYFIHLIHKNADRTHAYVPISQANAKSLAAWFGLEVNISSTEIDESRAMSNELVLQ
jgi:hypothetical protein